MSIKHTAFVLQTLMLRLHIQVWQPETEQKTCIKLFTFCQAQEILRNILQKKTVV